MRRLCKVAVAAVAVAALWALARVLLSHPERPPSPDTWPPVPRKEAGGRAAAEAPASLVTPPPG